MTPLTVRERKKMCENTKKGELESEKKPRRDEARVSQMDSGQFKLHMIYCISAEYMFKTH